jgi:glutamyl-tRNA reductase
MSNLVLVGLNYRTAKLDVRQAVAFSSDHLPEELNRLSSRPGILESMIMSTCNRVEILSTADDQSSAFASLESFLSEYSGIPLAELQTSLYRYSDEQAIRHVFRVASSLDSMVLGEPQILGQVKSSYSAAVEARTVGTYLNSLLQAAFRVAKRVRSETSIGEYSVSVSSAAVELIRKILGDLRKRSILVVGAGEMGEAAIRYLAGTGAKAIYLANRTPEIAQELARNYHGIAVPFTELRQWITRSDVVITSTGASEILIDRALIQHIMHERKNSPLVLIDISVPRNIDPGAGGIDNVFCYDIDDLATVVEANLHERVKAASSAENIVDQEVQAFCKKLKSLDVGAMAAQVQDRIEEICKDELQRCLRKMGPQEPKEIQELERMISRIAGKIAHPLLMQLRSGSDPIDASAYMDLINKILKPKDTAKDTAD